MAFTLQFIRLILKQEINIEEEVNKYMEGKIKNNKEKFFTEKLTKDLDIIINIIKEQQKTCYLDKTLYEEKITVEKENYTLTGIIDKVLYKEYDNKTSCRNIECMPRYCKKTSKRWLKNGKFSLVYFQIFFMFCDGLLFCSRL